MHPWNNVAVDLVGPWTIKVKEITMEFHALTIIDVDTNLSEAIRIDNKTSKHIATQFENTWLSRYPKPAYCIHDRDTEFTGNDFQMMLRKYNIRSRQITTKNPQANTICERMHQSMANQIRSVYNNNPPKPSDNTRQLIDTLSANVIYVVEYGTRLNSLSERHDHESTIHNRLK